MTASTSSQPRRKILVVIYLIVRSLYGAVVMELALAGDAGEALFVIKTSFGIHFFGLENLWEVMQL